MLNKHRVIELKSFLAHDHAKDPILVTMTMQAFVTSPYTVSVQWDNDAFYAQVHAYSNQPAADQGYWNALGFNCAYSMDCEHLLCGRFGQPMARDTAAESFKLYGNRDDRGNGRGAVPMLNSAELDRRKMEAAGILRDEEIIVPVAKVNPYVPPANGWTKPLPQGRFFNFENNSAVVLTWDPKKLEKQLANTSGPEPSVVNADTRKEFNRMLAELQRHLDRGLYLAVADDLMDMQTCGFPWIRGWAGAVVATITSDVPISVVLEEEPFKSNVTFSRGKGYDRVSK